jgi:Tfp pilus assembly protein PilF
MAEERAVGGSPRHARYREDLVGLGRRLLEAEEDRHDEAIVVLRRAVAAQDPEAVPLLARAYLDRGEPHEVVDLLSHRVAAGWAALAPLLAEALTTVGDNERAERAYRIALLTGDPEVMHRFGQFLRDQARYREAEQILRRAARAGSAGAVVSLVAVQWDGLGDQHAATATAEHWADEARPTTLLGLALVRAAVGRHDEAERLYRRAAELGAERGHLEYAAFLQAVRGDLDAAERELTAAEQAQEPEWGLAFGQFLAEVGRVEEARAYLRHAAHWGSEEAEELLLELDTDTQDE